MQKKIFLKSRLRQRPTNRQLGKNVQKTARDATKSFRLFFYNKRETQTQLGARHVNELNWVDFLLCIRETRPRNVTRFETGNIYI